MSSIGRIFVILNLVLAAGFVGWASTSLAKGNQVKQELDAERAAHAATRKQLEDETSRLKTELATEKGAKDQFREARDAADAEASRNAKDLAEAKEANAQLRGDVSKISATLEGYQQTIAALEQAKDAAVTEARDLERQRDAAKSESDKALTDTRNAQEALRVAQTKIADLERNLTSARKELDSVNAEITQLVAATGYDRNLIQDVGQIEGRVLQVNNDLKPGLVALNVGSDQGVKRGTTFQIFSAGVWKGQVRVESVQASMSSALIVTLKPGMTIAQGDSAATIL